MASTLLDHSRSAFSSSMVNELAGTLHEDPASIQKALNGLIPVVMSGIINRAESNGGGAMLHHLLTCLPVGSDPTAARFADDYSQQAADAGNDLLKKLFSYQSAWVVESTVTHCRVSTESATTLIGLVALVVISLLRKQTQTKKLTQAQLTALLRDEAYSARLAVQTALTGANGWYKNYPTSSP